MGRIPKGQAKKERVTLTLSPEVVRLLQDASTATGRPMSSLVEIAIEWIVLDARLEEASAFVLKRRLAMAERVFGAQIEAARQHRIAQGLPPDDPQFINMRFRSDELAEGSED